MEVAAKLSGARISAQKARLVADQIRGKKVGEALNLLAFSSKKAAEIMKKVLESAVANAEHNEGADVDDLKVASRTSAFRYKGSDLPIERIADELGVSIAPVREAVRMLAGEDLIELRPRRSQCRS